ncbi:hypothetical protein CC80DRAFT_502044 [Byssothecium circinans]|uniref:Uncharacterized protein n=1 Tax=Byssothecium circinans TaxID=147558 RepID=A0A6A5UAL8_9PLEO|nr:hypothetical protein CC80DRAFT_502044 [Byssothecium circinans]
MFPASASTNESHRQESLSVDTTVTATSPEQSLLTITTNLSRLQGSIELIAQALSSLVPLKKNPNLLQLVPVNENASPIPYGSTCPVLHPYQHPAYGPERHCNARLPHSKVPASMECLTTTTLTPNVLLEEALELVPKLRPYLDDINELVSQRGPPCAPAIPKHKDQPTDWPSVHPWLDAKWDRAVKSEPPISAKGIDITKRSQLVKPRGRRESPLMADLEYTPLNVTHHVDYGVMSDILQSSLRDVMAKTGQDVLGMSEHDVLMFDVVSRRIDRDLWSQKGPDGNRRSATFKDIKADLPSDLLDHWKEFFVDMWEDSETIVAILFSANAFEKYQANIVRPAHTRPAISLAIIVSE